MMFRFRFHYPDGHIEVRNHMVPRTFRVNFSFDETFAGVFLPWFSCPVWFVSGIGREGFVQTLDLR